MENQNKEIKDLNPDLNMEVIEFMDLRIGVYVIGKISEDIFYQEYRIY